jgi:heme A synthase
LTVLFLRIILSLLLAFLIGRFFFPGASVLIVLGFAAILFALAYLFEYTRKKEKGRDNGT